MKKFILSVAVLATITLSAVAADDTKTTKDDSQKVSNYVIDQFNSEFTGAKEVTWTVTGETQKANFLVNGVAKTAFFNMSGAYLGVTQEVTLKAVPALGLKVIAKEYAGYTATGQVIKFQAEDPEMPNYTNSPITQAGATNYFVSLAKGDSEILVQVSQEGTVSYFKKVK